MKITDIALGTVSIPLITPFKTSLRTVDRIQDLVVRVTLDGETIAAVEVLEQAETPDIGGVALETLPEQFDHSVRFQFFIHLLEESFSLQIAVQNTQFCRLFRLGIL